MAEAMIRLDRVSKTWPGSAGPAVDDLSLEIHRGEVVCLVGPSGCGKTTTLKMINRLVEPSSGRILLDGRDVMSVPAPELRRGIGYVIQQGGLFPHRTVAANIGTVPGLLGWSKERISARVADLLDLVGLDRDLASRYPSELSGGQQQRVGVARALAADPPVLLMDEPFGAVDPIVRQRLQDELLALQTQLRKTIVFVTHDIDEAIRLGDRVAVLNVGGVLEQYGSPDEVLAEPANGFVEAFLGSERGLKRLSLVRVGDLEPEPGPVVPPGASAEQAREVAAAHGVDWVGVVEGDRLLGWTSVDGLAGLTRLDGSALTPFRVWTRPDATLREALDALVRSHTPVAVVFDEQDRYLGMLFVSQLASYVR
ncbi:MAG TPA: ABC transporter ATP-binding protein [Actinomycetota bacterium]|nr:ABC transporter ATP-binding protein [Actinomycetota bacterium]